MSRQAKKKSIGKYRILIGKLKVNNLECLQECFFLRRENYFLKKEIDKLEEENNSLKNRGLISRIFG